MEGGGRGGRGGDRDISYHTAQACSEWELTGGIDRRQKEGGERLEEEQEEEGGGGGGQIQMDTLRLIGGQTQPDGQTINLRQAARQS